MTITDLLKENEALRVLVRSLESDRDRARARLQKGGGPDGSVCDGDYRVRDMGVAENHESERDHRGRRSADLTDRPGRTVGTVRPGRSSVH